MKQTSTLFLVRPSNIRSNEETALNNFYQQNNLQNQDFQTLANLEFDTLVEKLKSVGIQVLVYEINDELDTPDAHFPNNWISFHKKGVVVIYPMFAPNRRLERRGSVLEFIKQQNLSIDQVIDYSEYEIQNLFLEGTGALVLDRVNKKAYCALSDRAHSQLLNQFCQDFNYIPVSFIANQPVNGERKPIYHTNVMMCVAEHFAVICLECIDNELEQKNVVEHLINNHKEIVELTEEQLTHFAGNMLEVINNSQQNYLVMSSSAYNCLTNKQLNQIQTHCKIIHSPIPTIESLGGGSVRCMMAEVIL